jgi:hypothetical protein
MPDGEVGKRPRRILHAMRHRRYALGIALFQRRAIKALGNRHPI